MKTAVSSYSLRAHVNHDFPYWEYPRYARDTFGVDAVEIIQWDIKEADAAGIDRLKDGLGEAGVALVSMPIDAGRISESDAAKRARDLRLIELWIEAAAYLGCPVTRVNSGDGALDVAVESYQHLVDFGVQHGVTISMENHGGLSANRETARALFERVPELAANPDFGNFKEQERYDFLAEIAPRARVVHAKTFDFDSSGRMPAFDFGRCVRIMEEAGFDGYYSIEFEGHGDQVDGVTRSLALLELVRNETARQRGGTG